MKRIPKYKPVMRGYAYSLDNRPSNAVRKAFFATVFRQRFEFDRSWRECCECCIHGECK